MILRAKKADFGLDDIRAMITTPDLGHRRTILRERRDRLVRHIARAQAALTLIDCALDCPHDDVTACPHFQAAVADRIGVARDDFSSACGSP